MYKGLNKAQTHRILEDLQRKALITELLMKMLALSKEEDDALYNDIKGMMNGNDKKEVT